LELLVLLHRNPPLFSCAVKTSSNKNYGKSLAVALKKMLHTTTNFTFNSKPKKYLTPKCSILAFPSMNSTSALGAGLIVADPE
jgi:hypothetical protein